MGKSSVSWLLLLASAVLEAVWATALGQSEGFTRPLPTMVFAVTATLSMIGLGLAIRSIPLGTAYAVWVGIGAALTVGWAMSTGVEPFSVLKVLFIAGIVGCAAGLKSLPAGSNTEPTTDDTPASGTVAVRPERL
ncbi:multidrug efflux SMR transporter [Pseudarthrobacter sp. AL07]|uniref:DMT family transporter n=1 Tax=unclassified Pseudarthrobacter TaxID=2647000 RepID=UPI00249B47DF|nr:MULTISPECIES: multidrug efflux SMR transporter [unclassified Pseudarthrobacter]MDI3195461.1 multidrug efflux SMR transporter [Pseudarthrobacter sp. AL20]MDI3209528.1 multidrug efflux SMR transporter [Pseudarthrobacter sp. AL07]